MARQVRGALVPGLLGGRRERRSFDPAAWEAYLRGRYLLDERSPPDPVAAEAELRRALALDPTLAHVALTDAYHAA